MITRRHHLLIAIIVLIVFSALVTFIVVSVRYQNSYALKGVVNTDSAVMRLQSAFSSMNDFPGSVGKDMVFLRTISSLSTFYNDSSYKTWVPLHKDIQAFIDKNEAYDEILVYKKDCVLEVRRVDQDNSNSLCSPTDRELQSVISHVNSLSSGSVYISKLIDYTRTVNGKLSTIPAIIYGTKVSIPSGKTGVLISVVNADYFLKDIRNLQRPGGKVLLLNTNGSYVVSLKQMKNLQSGVVNNFYNDYALVPKHILANTHIREFQTKNNTFTFMHIIPTTNNFALYDSTYSKTQKQNGSSYWTIVAVSTRNNSDIWWLSEEYITDISIIFIMHALLIVALYIAIFPTEALKEMFDKECPGSVQDK